MPIFNPPKFRAYGDFSGPVIMGSVPYRPIHIVGHWERAFYITSLVECNAMMGSVVMYDGTVVTAGLHQAILVYPQQLAKENFQASDDQGSLVKLLTMIDTIPHFSTKDDLWGEMAKNSWKLQEGRLVYTQEKPVTFPKRIIRCRPGETVLGADLRNTICAPNGKVPSSGPQWVTACDWAQMFSAVMSDPRTFDMQIKFGMDSTVDTCKSRKVGNVSVLQFMYNGEVITQPFADCSELDLAMTMYHSHAVNAPAIANKCLNAAMVSTKFPGTKAASLEQKRSLAKALVTNMGTSDYGQWDDDLPNGRYQRTRSCMMQSKFWPDSFFSPTGIMPKDLVG